MTRYISRILRLAYIIEQAHGASFSQAVIVLGKYEVHDIIAKLPMGSKKLFGIFYTMSGYPLTKRNLISSLDIGGEVGAIGAKAMPREYLYNV